MLTNISNNSIVPGYSVQQISTPPQADTLSESSKDRRGDSDNVNISRKAQSLQTVYDKKKRTLEENYSNETRQLEQEFLQEKKRLESEFNQKTQSLGINTYV